MSLLNRLYSHPNKLLYEHLQKVGYLCNKNLSLKKLNIDDYLDFDTLRDVSYLIGISHDFGKSTSYFQDYLIETDGIRKTKLRNQPETHHGFISALFAYYVIKEYLFEKKLLDKKYFKYLPIISFLVIKKHHGNLMNALDEVIDFDQKNEAIFLKQINAIDFKELNFIYEKLFSKINFNYDCNLFKKNILDCEAIYIYQKLNRWEKKYVRDLGHREKRIISNLEEEDTLFYYSITLLLYSLLLDADKTDAVGLKEIKRVDIKENIVDRYIEEKFKKNSKQEHQINTIRNAIYHEVIANLGKIDLDKEKLLSLNVPTGTGKTLTSLSFAIKLRKRIEKAKQYRARIIYSLPYLSIIDQNFSVFEDVFKLSLNGEYLSSNLLLKHHHLSDVTYTNTNFGKEEFENIPSEDKKDVSKDILLIEGWNSEIIVTTFIQLFYSLISNRNKAIRKFHNIVNSIIILDEVQAIPHYYWVLLNKMMKFLTEKFNLYFILITATQPLLFNEASKEIKPLIKNKNTYFNVLNRVELILNLEPLCLDKFKEILEMDLVDNQNKDYLIVLNTISSSQEIYDFIKGLNLKNTKNYYLSAGVIPRFRLKRIKDSRKQNQKRKIIVSTQLIEAGVDLDVDIVYRDFAPLDSINQVAGRCNRNFSQEKGMVKIFILKQEEEKKEFHKYIYDPFLISKTIDTFKEFKSNQIMEKEFLLLNNFYFDKVSRGKSDDKSMDILSEVKKLNFEEMSKFKLIETDYPKVDIFVELDEEAQEVYRKYQEIKVMENPFKRKNEFLKIRKDFYDYVISVPFQYAADFIEDEDTAYIPKISKEEIEQGHYYDIETGFKKKKESDGGALIY